MLDAGEVLERAREVAEVFAEHAAEGERLRQMPEPSLRAVVDSELFSTLVPKRFGGHELNFDIVAQVGRELAKGDIASAWATMFMLHHNWQFALFPLETQEELWADRPFALAPAMLQPQGRATPVEGGYRVTGRWQWASGIMHSDWILVTALVESADGGDRIEPGLVLVPIADVDVVDVWHTAGMRATGSNDAAVTDAFVPDRRCLTMREISKRAAPGHLVTDNPLYRLDMFVLLSIDACSTGIGGAEAAVELFRAKLADRVLVMSGGRRQREQPAAQIRLARAAAVTRTARLLWERAIDELCAPLHGGDYPTRDQKIRLRLDCAHALALVREAVALVSEGVGASSQFLDSPFQRVQRDITTMSGHMLFDYDRAAELQGTNMLGLPVPAGMSL